jgi:hypothetical protein
VLPSCDGTASDHAGRETLMNAGSSRESFAPIGSNLPGYNNYFCRDCRRIVHVRKGSSGFRERPTPGCTRPTGQRPRAPGHGPAPRHPNGEVHGASYRTAMTGIAPNAVSFGHENLKQWIHHPHPPS